MRLKTTRGGIDYGGEDALALPRLVAVRDSNTGALLQPAQQNGGGLLV